MRFTLSILFVVFFCVSFSAMAGEDYVCNNNGEKRIISVEYKSDQQSVPCEVKYDKGEGVQTLWSAQSEVGFCETKANEFIEKQESWGWSCDKFEVPEADVPLEELHTSLY